MMDDLIRKVESFCKKENLLDRQDTVIVAVSGGPDSIALLHILAALQERWMVFAPCCGLRKPRIACGGL